MLAEDRRKLIMGIGTYGVSYKLKEPISHGIGLSAYRNWVDEDPNGGTLTYFDICSKLKRKELKDVYGDDLKSAYAHADTFWISFDNVQAVTEKANYINKMNLGGVMLWAVDNDDFDNVCGDGRYPLISKVYNMVVGLVFYFPSKKNWFEITF